MANIDAMLIDTLQHGQKDVVVKVLVVRQGYQLSTAPTSRIVRKLIFMDAQGALIHGLVFSNALQQFGKLLNCDKTYLICNPVVKQINSSYPNVNPKLELILQPQTTVTELPNEPFLATLNFRFKEFAQIASDQQDTNDQNIIGIIKEVRPVINLTKHDNNVVHRREVILFNTLLDLMTITLWDDIALNEGQLLQQIQEQNPIIAFCNLKINIYQGIQLKSTSKTAMLVNPPCQQTEITNSWLESNAKRKTVYQLWMEKMIKESEQVNLIQLKNEKRSLEQNKYYYIKARIKEIENKSSPWYEACDHCYKAVDKTSRGFNCTNCVNLNIKVVPRYRMTILVEDSNGTARVTLFEKVAEAFIGCPVQKYIEKHTGQRSTIQQDKMLYHSTKENYKFLFKLDSSISEKNDIISITGEAVEKPDSQKRMITDDKKRRTRTIKEIEKDAEKRTNTKEAANSCNKKEIHLSSKEAGIEIQDDENIGQFNERLKKHKQTTTMEKAKKVTIKKEKI